MADLHDYVVEGPARDFCYEILCIVATYDDLIDRDKAISDDAIHSMMFSALVTLPRNAFYRQFFEMLNPLIINSISNWRIANKMEKEKRELEAAFIIRSSYADIMCMCVLLTEGPQAAELKGVAIRELVHNEGLSAYLEEMKG